MTRWLELYSLVVVHLGTIPATLFPLFYSRSPWRSTDVGKALMTKGIAIALLFDVSVLAFWVDDLPGIRVIRALVFTLVVAGVTYQFHVMRSLQHKGRDHKTPDGEF